MILALPNALPPASLAAELGRRLGASAPTLVRWLASATPTIQTITSTEDACTPLEAWQLQHAGYTPPADVPLGAGWAVLAASVPPADTEAVWLADFVHLHVSHQGVTLTDPAALALDIDETRGLLAAARPYLDDAGIGAQLDGALRLRLTLPDTLAPYAPTPAAAIGSEIQTWWSQHPGTRPWRRVLNEIQMAWHDDPINQARARRGQLPVNGLWIFGGGRLADFGARQERGEAVNIEYGLSAPALAGDWAAWLDAAARLEQERFIGMANTLAQREAPPLKLVLTGEDRLVCLTVQAPRGLSRWLPRRQHNWQDWWSAPATPHAP